MAPVEIVVAAKPDVFNHNLETVPRIYRPVRPGADYGHSIHLLTRAKLIDPATNTEYFRPVSVVKTSGPSVGTFCS